MDVPLAVTNSNNNDTCSSTNLATRSYPLMLLLNATSLRKPNALQHTICVNCSNRMANLADASPKNLWAAARNDGNGSKRSGSYVTQRLLSNPDLVNEFFAAISTTNAYNDATVWTLRAELEQYSSQTYVNGYELEPVLRRLKNILHLDAMRYPLGFIVIVHLNWQML